MPGVVYSSSSAARMMGGESVVAGLNRQAADLDLPACPFCGGGAVVCFGTEGAQLCAAARCGRCGASTQTVRGAVAGALLAACALRWKRRA